MRKQFKFDVWLFLMIVLMSSIAWSLPGRAGPYLDYATGLVTSPPEGSSYRPDLEALLADYANSYRDEKGRKPLKPDDTFRAAARAQAADMMLNNYVGHQASTGHGFESRMRAFAGDITRFPALAENAARDTQKTPVDAAKAKALFQQWVESSSHRRTLTSRAYNFVSTGVIQRGDKIWAVQIFWATPRAKGMFQ